MGISKHSRRIVDWLSVAAAVAAAVMMCATVVDVLMANLFNRPIVGTFDLVETMLPCLVFLGIPQVFLSEGNITVDILDHVASARAVVALRMFAAFAAFVFLGVMLWQMLGAARDAYAFGDRKPDLPIMLFVIWIPVLIGTACALLAAATLVCQHIRQLHPESQQDQ
jgi:TRAP-type C4-dicarboxylate transport system permease small subunit